MTTDEIAVAPDVAVIDRSSDLYSPGWWQSRSTEELREIINRGIANGPVFEGATIETERRAREHLRIEDNAADAQAARNKRLRLLILEAVLVTCLFALIAALLMR